MSMSNSASAASTISFSSSGYFSGVEGSGWSFDMIGDKVQHLEGNTVTDGYSTNTLDKGYTITYPPS